VAARRRLAAGADQELQSYDGANLARMSDAWIAFARSGDPNHPGLPHWAPFTPETGATMLFDDTCSVANDPDREALRVSDRL